MAYLTYNILLVSGVQHNDLGAVCMYFLNEKEQEVTESMSKYCFTYMCRVVLGGAGVRK